MGEDESYVIGTEEQLLSFAASIVESVNTVQPDTFFEEDVLVSDSIRGSQDDKAEIQLDEIVIVKNNVEKDRLFYKIYSS